MMILPRLNVNGEWCYHAIKKFYKQKYELEPNRFMKCKQFRQDLPGFSVCARTHRACKVIVLYPLAGSNNCELKVLMY
jgi:hypothetical protein